MASNIASPSNETPKTTETGEPVSPTPTPPHKQLSRRNVLALAGAGTLVLVAGGAVWRAADQGVFSTGEGPAYEPWQTWRSAPAGPLNLVRAAILAANAHNTQPWLFHVTETRLDLFADISRRIGLTDPVLE